MTDIWIDSRPILSFSMNSIKLMLGLKGIYLIQTFDVQLEALTTVAKLRFMALYIHSSLK